MSGPLIFTPASHDEWLALRVRYLTSTEVAALFGASPYEGALSLFLRKQAGDLGERPDTERMFWGRELEAAIAAGAAKQHQWTVRRLAAFMADPDEAPARLGASFDFETDQGDLVEVKNVDRQVWRSAWSEAPDGAIAAAPPWIELQIQAQLAVAQRARAFLVVLVGGNTLKIGERTRDESVIAAIRDRAARFWRELHSGLLPPPDYTRDQAAIAALVPTPGQTADFQNDAAFLTLVQQYRAHKRAARDADEAAAKVRAEIEFRMGEAERAQFAQGVVARRRVPETVVSYTRKAYCDFRVLGGSHE